MPDPSENPTTRPEPRPRPGRRGLLALAREVLRTEAELSGVYTPRISSRSRSTAARPPQSAAAPSSLAPATAPIRDTQVPAIIGSAAKTAVLVPLAKEVAACVKCGLCKSRTQTVFGVGSADSPIVFVGEAPGADEDRQGEPFVGRAGQLLTKCLGELGISRRDVYIANVLKCRPPENRPPQPAEVAACRPYLVQQIQTIQPRVICTLGTHSAQAFLGVVESMGRMRGQVLDWKGIAVHPTYHPAYILRNASAYSVLKADIRKALAAAGLLGAP